MRQDLGTEDRRVRGVQRPANPLHGAEQPIHWSSNLDCPQLELDRGRPKLDRMTGFTPRNPSGVTCEQPVDQIAWRPEPDGSRTCPVCGSLHPDDFIDILWRYGQREEGYQFSTTTKGDYKFYANRPGTGTAGSGGIKFYGQHMPPDRGDEFKAAFEIALLVYDQELQKQFPNYRGRG